MTADEYMASFPPGEDAEKRRFSDYHNNKYEIVSLVGFLIGIDRDVLEERENGEGKRSPFQKDIWDTLEQNSSARIIRNLCRVRTALMSHFQKISHEFRYNLTNLGSLPEFIPKDAVDQLSADGISLQKSHPDVTEYMIAINKEISNRIGICQSLFPEWINWEYIKALFKMPQGTKPEGVKAAGKDFQANFKKYPYQTYLNWQGPFDGNILYHDAKFVELLYEANEDVFDNLSLVRDVGDIARGDMQDFFTRATQVVVSVDCENSDPIRLAAALSSLSKPNLEKIGKVLLFDSDYTTTEWEILPEWNVLSSKLDIRRNNVKRVKVEKSQLDQVLATQTALEVALNHSDAVMLVSSDSDYLGSMQTIRNTVSDCRFLVMVEKEKFSERYQRELENDKIPYCFLNDFYTGASFKIKTMVLTTEIQKKLDEALHLNAASLLDSVIASNWVQMTPKERDKFYDRYLKKMRAEVASDGTVRLKLGE